MPVTPLSPTLSLRGETPLEAAGLAEPAPGAPPLPKGERKYGCASSS